MSSTGSSDPIISDMWPLAATSSILLDDNLEKCRVVNLHDTIMRYLMNLRRELRPNKLMRPVRGILTNDVTAQRIFGFSCYKRLNAKRNYYLRVIFLFNFIPHRCWSRRSYIVLFYFCFVLRRCYRLRSIQRRFNWRLPRLFLGFSIQKSVVLQKIARVDGFRLNFFRWPSIELIMVH